MGIYIKYQDFYRSRGAVFYEKKSSKIAVIIVIGLGIAVWYGSRKEKPAVYVTESLEKGDITEKITASGIINPISTINIGTQVSGTIAEIFVDYNSEVKKISCWLRLIRPCLKQRLINGARL